MSFQLTTDTLCYPIPIHFVSLSNNNLTMRIDNVNISERELEEELGLKSDNLKLDKIDRITEKLKNNRIISNEYVSS